MTTATEKVILSGPAPLVASVPYLVGFTPEHSVVGVWLKNGTILVTQRVDLEVLTQPEAFYGPLLDKEPSEIILISYGDVDTDAFLAFADEIKTAFFDTSFTIRDILWVKDGRWGSHGCTDPECYGPNGREIDTTLAVELIGAGRAPVESREDLLKECLPQGTRNTRGLPAKDKLEAYRDASIAAFTTMLEGWGVVFRATDTGLMRELGRSLHDIRVRDTILYDITTMDQDELPMVYSLLSDVCKASTPDQAAPTCTVAAIAAWLMGDGARSSIALEYAESADPSYSLAMMLRASLSHGLPPQAWRDAMTNLNRDDCRHGSE